jgi:hypothetical protein
MRKITLIFEFGLVLSMILLIIFKNDLFLNILLISLLLYSIFNIVFGFIVFRPNINYKNAKTLSVLNGICAGISVFLLIVRFIDPLASFHSTRINIIPLGILILVYILIMLQKRFFLHKSYYAYIQRPFNKSVAMIIILLIVGNIHPDVIATAIFRYDSPEYQEYSFDLNYSSIQRLIDQDELDSALRLVNIQLDEYNHIVDHTGSRYQRFVLIKGFILYNQDRDLVADSLISSVLGIYQEYDKNNIQELFIPDYCNCYYKANYYSGLINIDFGNYEKADSLISNSLKYYKNNSMRSEMYFYKAYIAFSSGNNVKADSLLELSMKNVSLTSYSSKRYLIAIINLVQIKILLNNTESAEYLLNSGLVLFDKKISSYRISDLSTEQKLNRLLDIYYEN